MGKGRRMGGGNNSRVGGGGCRNLNVLNQRIDSCRNRFSDDVEDIVNHLRTYPAYSRMKQKLLTGRVKQRLLQSPARKSTTPLKQDDYEEEAENTSRERTRKKQKRGDENEERLIQLEDEHLSRRRPNRDHVHKSESDRESESDSDSQEEPPCSSSVSTSSMDEDAIYGEKFEPKHDLMRLMVRDGYASGGGSRAVQSTPRKEKNIEIEEFGNEKTKASVRIEIPNRIKKSSINISKDTAVENGDKEKDKNYDEPTFADLGGMQGVLKELKYKVLYPLYNPELPRRVGIKPITGILLHGPPGCGKTKLAHAIANEANIPFHKISAAEIVSGVSGASEKNIRTLFKKAYRTSPSIVFIDEIDAIASKRQDSQREVDRRIVTQLMTCMDEFHKPVNGNSESESSNQRSGYVLVIGATNRPDAIDPALRRPGRFDREIELGVPDESARTEILLLLTRKCILEGSLDLLEIARSTPGFVGADLEALVNEAGNLAMTRFINERESELAEGTENGWKVPCLPEEIEKLAITMADFKEAAKLVQPSSRREGFSTVPDVKWEDVGGLDSIRKVFDLHIVRRIKHPERFKKIGLNLATGFLLYGPPGCGKTLIAMAAANESGANFIYVKGPELFDKYVGESERSVRTLFTRARTCSPCLVFIDEVDALTIRRGREEGVADRVINQLLIELDGADKRENVFVIGATNRPEVMDPALLRPGRFGKHLYVPLPSSDDRGLILRALAKGKPNIDPEVDLSAIGHMKACENLSGADLKDLMNEAAKAAFEEAEMMDFSDNHFSIKTRHFEQALSSVAPSVSDKQIRFYKIWSDSFKAA